MKNVLLALPLAALVFLGAGCGDASRGSGVSSARAVPSCGNAYFPLQQGYSATYRNTFPGGTPSEYTMAVERVEGNVIDLHTTFSSGSEGVQTLTCGPDGVVMARNFLALGGSGGLLGQATTTAVRGELMPSELRVGATWTTDFDIQGAMGSSPTDPLAPRDRVTQFEATISIAREVIGKENVTVPAGTFSAFKVRSTMNGFSVFGPIVSYEWWSSGKGLVKVTTGDDQSIVSEAISIRTP